FRGIPGPRGRSESWNLDWTFVRRASFWLSQSRPFHAAARALRSPAAPAMGREPPRAPAGGPPRPPPPAAPAPRAAPPPAAPRPPARRLAQVGARPEAVALPERAERARAHARR